MSHTPGPWKFSVTSSPPKREFVIESQCGRDIARYLKYDDYPRHSAEPAQVEANARLIASAPELLAALKDLLSVRIIDPDKYEAHAAASNVPLSSDEKRVCDAIRQAQSIVAKAEALP